jgi:hypothetical protein
MPKSNPVWVLFLFLAIWPPCAFSDDVVTRIVSGSLRIYEKYLPFNDYVRLCMVRDAVMHTEKTDPNMSRHIRTISENEILNLHRICMAKLAEKISLVDQKMAELCELTGAERAEIAILNKEYAGYKTNIDQYPESDEVIDKIEKLYAELILRKRYEQRMRETIYFVKEGDWLVKISEMDIIYGDWRKWRLIYQANKDIMPNPNNPALIFPGMRLVIPRD